MLAHSFLIESSSKLLVTTTGIKARTSSISGLWFPWPIYVFFLNEIWPWHIGLRWAIVALWATCFAYSVSFVSQYIPQQFCFSSPESKAHWWVYRIGRSLSSVVPPSSVRRPHSLNISSETTGPSKWNFIWSFSGMEERKFVQTVTK